MTWNVPNILTIIRVLLVPVFVYFVLCDGSGARLAALLIFSTACLTDYLDGRIARTYNQRSEFGKFADPLADKLLVTAALVAFVFIPETAIPLWMVLLILARETLITWLRISALRRHESVETSFMGKSKTAAQMITIVAVLILLIARAYISENLDPTEPTALAAPNAFWECYAEGSFWGDVLDALPFALMAITCFLTVYSGGVYLWVNRKLL